MFGNNPDAPHDLGAEIELCIGPEMERFVFNRSCCLKIPSGTPHGFYHINKCHRPWLFEEIHESNSQTEKFPREYLTDNEKAAIPEKSVQ